MLTGAASLAGKTASVLSRAEPPGSPENYPPPSFPQQPAIQPSFPRVSPLHTLPLCFLLLFLAPTQPSHSGIQALLRVPAPFPP